MTDPSTESATPTLAAGTKLRWDDVRSTWVMLCPERLFLLDAQAAGILQLVDGKRRVGDIVDELAGRFETPRGVIAHDITVMLRDLASKGVVRL